MTTGIYAADGSMRVVQTDGAGNNLGGGAPATVSGNVASGAADSGNPVKMAGVYNSTKPTFTNGQRGDVQIGTRGALSVQINGADALTAAAVTATGADGASNTMNGLVTDARLASFNGTTWDSRRSIVNATNSTGTGISSVGLVAQLDDTSPTAITENQFGNLRITPSRALLVATEGRTQTFSAGSNNVTPAATTTDFFTLRGSGTKTVRIRYIKMYATATAVGSMRAFVYRATTAPSGGTSSAPTMVAVDTTNAAASALFTVYTANPTVASGLSLLQNPFLTFTTVGQAKDPFIYEDRPGSQPITLRGTSELLVFNFGGVAVPAGALIHIEQIVWTEE